MKNERCCEKSHTIRFDKVCPDARLSLRATRSLVSRFGGDNPAKGIVSEFDFHITHKHDKRGRQRIMLRLHAKYR